MIHKRYIPVMLLTVLVVGDSWSMLGRSTQRIGQAISKISKGTGSKLTSPKVSMFYTNQVGRGTNLSTMVRRGSTPLLTNQGSMQVAKEALDQSSRNFSNVVGQNLQRSAWGSGFARVLSALGLGSVAAYFGIGTAKTETEEVKNPSTINRDNPLVKLLLKNIGAHGVVSVNELGDYLKNNKVTTEEIVEAFDTIYNDDFFYRQSSYDHPYRIALGTRLLVDLQNISPDQAGKILLNTAKKHDLDLMKLVLQKQPNANVNITKNGTNALMYIVQSINNLQDKSAWQKNNGYQEIITTLLKNTDPTQKDDNGKTIDFYVNQNGPEFEKWFDERATRGTSWSQALEYVVNQ